MNGSFVTRMHSLQVPRTQPIVIQPQTVSPQTLQSQSAECLEQYVVEMMGNDEYHLLEWRSNRETYRHLRAESYHYPHLEFESRKSHSKFAIKCIWKKKIADNPAWASSRDIAGYLDYQEEKDIPVYVLIAVGENPCAPDEMFVLPLRDIKDHLRLQAKDLAPYNFRPGDGLNLH